MTDRASQPTETAKAAEAFSAYVGMGPGRSLTNLAHLLVERNWYKTTPTARRLVAEWSSKYRWQERITAAVTEKSERYLAHAAEIDADSFKRTSEILRERLGMVDDPIHLDAVVKIRETVRRPAPKSGSTGVDVNVQVSVSLRDLAQRVAEEEGVDADELIADVERYLRTGA